MKIKVIIKKPYNTIKKVLISKLNKKETNPYKLLTLLTILDLYMKVWEISTKLYRIIKKV